MSYNNGLKEERGNDGKRLDLNRKENSATCYDNAFEEATIIMMDFFTLSGVFSSSSS